MPKKNISTKWIFVFGTVKPIVETQFLGTDPLFQRCCRQFLYILFSQKKTKKP